MRFELAPQLHDVDFECVRQAVVALIPDLLVDVSPRQHLIDMAKEKNQKRILLRGEIEALARPLHALRGEVDPHAVAAQDRALAAVLSPRHDANPSEQLLESERLAEVIVGT